MSKIKSFFMDESGQAMTEYGLIIALVAVAVVGVIVAMSGKLSGLFNAVTNDL
ncbi:MAG: Flp family type IVb pilin [Desulfosporosinus sp.]|nr:Flp family type IVb pilin [Desulfosporosinus sp.]